MEELRGSTEQMTQTDARVVDEVAVQAQMDILTAELMWLDGRRLEHVHAHAHHVIRLVEEAGDSTVALEEFGTIDQLVALVTATTHVLAAEARLIVVDAPVIVVGDVHGSLVDTRAALRTGAGQFASRYLFIGDYVDKGPQQVETLWYLIALKLVHPTRIFLLRGDHEMMEMNKPLGAFKEQLQVFAGGRYDELFQSIYGETIANNHSLSPSAQHARKSAPGKGLFPELALGALVRSKDSLHDIFCVHGGIGKDLQSVHELTTRFPRRWRLTNKSWMSNTRSFIPGRQRPNKEPNELPAYPGAVDGEGNVRTEYGTECFSLLENLLWSDPQPETTHMTDGDVYEGRGEGLWNFGLRQRLPAFMVANNLRVVIRGHQATEVVDFGFRAREIALAPGQHGSLVTVHTGQYDENAPPSAVLRPWTAGAGCQL